MKIRNLSCAIICAVTVSDVSRGVVPPNMPTAPPNLAVAVVTYGSTGGFAVSRCPKGIFELVAVQPDQTVQVTIQYPASQALQTVLAETLDGGAITFPAGGSVIGADGTLSFTFQAGHDPGLNQVSLRAGVQELGLQFWVLDTQNPQNNPLALSPSNPMN
jgi:hypothetical protein